MRDVAPVQRLRGASGVLTIAQINVGMSGDDSRLASLVDFFKRGLVYQRGIGGAISGRVVSDVARVGPLPAVAGGSDRTIAPNQLRRGEGRAFGSIRAARSWSSRATHQIEPFSPTTHIELGDGADGANAAASERCNRRDTSCDDGADCITVPFIVKPSQTEQIDPAGSPVVLGTRGHSIDRGDVAERGVASDAAQLPRDAWRKAVRDLALRVRALPGIGASTLQTSAKSPPPEPGYCKPPGVTTGSSIPRRFLRVNAQEPRERESCSRQVASRSPMQSARQ